MDKIILENLVRALREEALLKTVPVCQKTQEPTGFYWLNIGKFEF